MKKTCFVLAVVWLLLPLLGLGQNEKWNAEGKIFLRECKKNPKSPAEKIPVFLYFDNEDALNQAQEAGFIPQTVVKGICTGLLPFNRISEIERIKGITRIHYSRKSVMFNDSMRKCTQIDLLQNYPDNGLDRLFDGSGVIVGVVDGGLDYTHPTFFKDPSDKSTYKIKKVWDQVADKEYIGTDAILAAAHDSWIGETARDHGSHVTAIAAGTGAGLPGSPYKGAAPGSDIVLVSTTFKNEDIVNGVAYIMDYAQEEGKPCVINLSLGSNIGIHDGTAPQDLMINQLSGPGRLVVASVGNAGIDSIHVGGTLHKGDSVIWRGIKMADASIVMNFITDKDKDISCTFRLRNRQGEFYTRNGRIEEVVFNTGISDTNFRYITVDTIPVLEFYAGNEEGKYKKYTGVQMTIISAVPNFKGYIPCLGFSTENNQADYHFWINAPSYLGNYGNPYFASGDCEYTLSGDFATADSVLAVSAYTTRNQWTNIQDSIKDYTSLHPVLGDIAYFSSRGPRADGIYKPDITAPGAYVVSAGNSFTPEIIDKDFYVANTTLNGKNYPWLAIQGTSMSSPAVAGIVALMLQANPNLTPGQTKRIIQQTAIRNEYVEKGGISRWGAGIINAYAAVMKALDEALTAGNENNPEYAVNGMLKRIYPNPCTNYVKVETACAGTLSIFSVNGKEIMQKRYGSAGMQTLNVTRLTPGMYLLYFEGTDGGKSFGKLMKK